MEFISIYLMTMVKFIAGPTFGYAAGFPWWKSVLVTILGMMSSVVLFAFFGEAIRKKVISKYFPEAKTFTKKNRRVAKLRRKYGMIGVAALSPIIFTPIGGTVILVGLRAPKDKIILYMAISAVVWSCVFVSGIYFFGQFLPEWMIPTAHR